MVLKSLFSLLLVPVSFLLVFLLSNIVIIELINYTGTKVCCSLGYYNNFIFNIDIIEVFDFNDPYEIEIAVRVCYGSSDPDHISIAQDLLQNASDRFPSSSVIHILYTILLFIIY